jgi:hypothetical protein
MAAADDGDVIHGDYDLQMRQAFSTQILFILSNLSR